MYFTYILYSVKCDKYYIGYSADVIARLERHNAGMVTATRNCIPYQLAASKGFSTEIEARKEELRLKKAKNRKSLEWLIAGNWQIRPD
jgi:putative endonuclease